VNDAWETRSIDSDISSTIEVIPRDAPIDVPSEDAQKDASIDPVQSQHGLPTPETTPAPPESSQQASPDIPIALIAPERPQPRQEIIGDLQDPRNIVEGSRTRRPKQRNEAYAADLANPEQLPAYHSAFALGVNEGKPKIHEKDLPPPPRFWKELQRYRYGKEFEKAAEKEYQAINDRGTFKIVQKTSDITMIPLTWVFTYKLDTDGYLAKFKARICVRGDLQPRNDRDTYAATLAARIFRALMAITAAYNLEAFQLDAVNAFTNSKLDETVYYAFPDGFQQNGKCLLMLRALYGLRRSPLLWLKEFSTTLHNLDLNEIFGQPCLFTTDDGIIIFFYIDDIVLLCRSEDLSKLDKLRTALKQRYKIRDLGKLS
jgi:Reverse transcriptase (RNA-dependent DNA polymerase)